MEAGECRAREDSGSVGLGVEGFGLYCGIVDAQGERFERDGFSSRSALVRLLRLKLQAEVPNLVSKRRKCVLLEPLINSFCSLGGEKAVVVFLCLLIRKNFVPERQNFFSRAGSNV